MLDGSHDGSVVGRYAGHRDVGAAVVGTAVAGSPLVAIAVVGICELGSRVVGASDVGLSTVCGPAVGAPLGIGAAIDGAKLGRIGADGITLDTSDVVGRAVVGCCHLLACCCEYSCVVGRCCVVIAIVTCALDGCAHGATLRTACGCTDGAIDGALVRVGAADGP